MCPYLLILSLSWLIFQEYYLYRNKLVSIFWIEEWYVQGPKIESNMAYYIICRYWQDSRFSSSMDRRCSCTWLEIDDFALDGLDPTKAPPQQGRLSTFFVPSSSSILTLYYCLCPSIYYLLACFQGNGLSCFTPLWYFNFLEFVGSFSKILDAHAVFGTYCKYFLKFIHSPDFRRNEKLIQVWLKTSLEFLYSFD